MKAAPPHSPAGHLHALVWIDHHEARIFRFDTEVSEATHHLIRDEHSPPHLHHKANSIGSGHAPVNHAYLEMVATRHRRCEIHPHRRPLQRQARALQAPRTAPSGDAGARLSAWRPSTIPAMDRCWPTRPSRSARPHGWGVRTHPRNTKRPARQKGANMLAMVLSKAAYSA